MPVAGAEDGLLGGAAEAVTRGVHARLDDLEVGQLQGSSVFNAVAVTFIIFYILRAVLDSYGTP